ncbi:MAG TPA: hypothetical protein VHM90_15350 [Phycisphaerae bacterium]|jgi:hypothetical protein|nr:hypothetical protein [Phycisphaerae bacterium]
MRLVLKVLPAILALSLAACAHRNTGPLIADAKSPISDVPVPAGFTMADNSTSKVVPGSSLRVVDHHYKGTDELVAVVTFYREELPKTQWTLVDQTQVSAKEITLHFTKRNEECSVTVTRKTFETEIRIRIDPVAGRAGQ